MRIIVLGGGLSGLVAADKLLDSGKVEVTILEKMPFLGGLARSIEVDGEQIPIFNHHIVRTNTKTLEYLRRYDLLGNNTWKRINLAIAWNNKVYNINKPWKYLWFKYLSLVEKIRFGLFGVYVSYFFNPDKLPDDLDAETWLNKACGKSVTQKMHYQLYARNKFNIPLSRISAKQFAHRMKEREFNDKFTYPTRGIQGLIDGLEQDVIRKGGKIIRKADTTHIDVQKRVITYKAGGKERTEVYDALINTIPVEEFMKFTKGLPKEYSDNLKKLKYTPVVGILFGTKEFLDPENYWINFFGERVHVMYQHSLLIDKYKTKITWVDRYGGSAEDLPKSDDEIKDLYLGALRKYFPKMDVKFCLVFRDQYAEPIYDKDYAKYAPKYRTPVAGLYNAGIQVTFPKIRNMNVALESGEKVAKCVLEDYK